jgi:hypothetical protein
VEITRVSLSPYDFRRAIGKDHVEVCARTSLREVTNHRWHERLIGERPALYTREASRHTLFLFADGFGLNLRRETYAVSSLGDHQALAHVLLERAAYHRQFRDGSHADIASMADIREGLRRCAGKMELRPYLWSRPPYTLSFFYLNKGLDDVVDCDAARQGLYSLLEPSQVMISALLDQGQTGVAECAKLITALNTNGLTDRYRNCDIRAGSSLLCSWAGPVMLDPHGDSLGYVESLEIRLQNAWLRAHYTRKYAESLLDERRLGLDELNQFSARTKPLLRQSQRCTSPWRLNARKQPAPLWRLLSNPRLRLGDRSLPNRELCCWLSTRSRT